MLLPTSESDHPFWAEYAAFMQATADSLGIDLTVVPASHRYEVSDVARKVLGGSDKPDYLVYIYQAQSSLEILGWAERVEVKSIITNTDVVREERHVAGAPRGRYKHWIGHVYPDDRAAGQLLADHLLDRAKALGLTRPGTLCEVVGIGGSRDTTVSVARELGLHNAIFNRKGVELTQYVLSNWSKELAYDKSRLLLMRYPKTKVFWAASDEISLMAIKAMKEEGLKPGSDILTGGIDWSREGIAAVKQGEMEATVGGHFLEGGWALVMIYDYHHGNDFARPSATLRSQMRLIDRKSLGKYLSVLDRKNWKRIDFKRFTRTHNPRLKEYDFSPDAVVRALGGR